jgi:hypothetical protein
MRIKEVCTQQVPRFLSCDGQGLWGLCKTQDEMGSEVPGVRLVVL